MTVNMDWGILNINVPRNEMLLIQTVPVEVRQLDLTEFRYAMHDKQDDDAGMAYLHMHEHNFPVTVAGVTLAQVVQIVNNYTVTFEDGLYNVNIVGGNSNVSDVVIKNKVGVNTANSAGLQDSTSLQAASFQGHVTVNRDEGFEGTVFPIGTNRYPCRYLSDAKEIATREGIDEILFKSAYDLGIDQYGEPEDVSGFHLVAISHAVGVLTIATEAVCYNTIFRGFNLSGVLDGDSEIHDCIVHDIDYFNGFIFSCALSGRITLGGNKNATFTNCEMHDVENLPIIDCGGSGQNATITKWSGKLIIDNMVGASKVGIGVLAGEIIINNTCSAGTVSAHGSGSLENNSGDGCYVIDKLSDGSEISNLHTIIEQLRPHHTGTGNIIYWDPYSGNDNWGGDHPDRAFKTFLKAHDTAENANHDTIFIVPGDPSGVTVITEAINVTKDYLFIRGPGRDTLVHHDVGSAIAVSLTTSARGTEFSGFRVQNDVSGGIGMTSTGAFTLCNNIWFENCANGVFFTEHHPLMHSCKVHGASGYAIKMEGAISHGEIYNCTAGDAGETTIQINTTADTGGIKMRDTIIVGSSGYGVSLSATTRKFISQTGNIVSNNALGNFNDLGTENVLNLEGTSSGGLSESELHDGLDSYGNKNEFMADVSYLAKSIYVDTDMPIDGDGSQGNPFNLIDSAKDYAELTGIKNVIVSGDIVVPSNIKNINIYGIGLARIDLNGQDVKGSKFYQCNLIGSYTDTIIAEECILEDGMLLSGHFKNCELGGNYIVGVKSVLFNCMTGLTNYIKPTISMNSGSVSEVSIKGYGGGLKIIDCDHTDDIITVSMHAGIIEFDSSCTNGTMIAGGTCRLIDNTIGKLVVDETIGNNSNIVSVQGIDVNSVDDFKADTVNVDLSGIPADVWSYVTRELTVAAGLTPDQEAKLDEIIVDISEVPPKVLLEVPLP